MKHFFLILFSFVGLRISAQILEPVKWEYESKKISNGSYEIHINTTIQNGWHLYSQTQPKDAIAIPTTIKFTKNPLLSFNGKPKEVGKKEKYREPSLGIEQWQYSNKVDFVQLVQVKNKSLKVKTEINGTIEFQTCTDKMCLPPKTINFSVELK